MDEWLDTKHDGIIGLCPRMVFPTPLFLENIHPLIACFGEDLFEGLFENYRQKVVSFWKIKQCQGLSTEKADHSVFWWFLFRESRPLVLRLRFWDIGLRKKEWKEPSASLFATGCFICRGRFVFANHFPKVAILAPSVGCTEEMGSPFPEKHDPSRPTKEIYGHTTSNLHPLQWTHITNGRISTKRRCWVRLRVVLFHKETLVNLGIKEVSPLWCETQKSSFFTMPSALHGKKKNNTFSVCDTFNKSYSDITNCLM